MPSPRRQFGPPPSDAASSTTPTSGSAALKARVIADIARVAAHLDLREGLRYDQYRAYGEFPSSTITNLGGWELLSEAAMIAPPSAAAILQAARRESARPEVTYTRKLSKTKRIRDPFDNVIGFAIGQNHCRNATARAA